MTPTMTQSGTGTGGNDERTPAIAMRVDAMRLPATPAMRLSRFFEMKFFISPKRSASPAALAVRCKRWLGGINGF